MKTDVTVSRRLFVHSYTQYLSADRAWFLALEKAAELVPDVVGKGYWRLGTSNSKLRRLYMERDRALHKLMVARAKLENAKQRRALKRQEHNHVTFLVDLG